MKKTGSPLLIIILSFVILLFVMFLATCTQPDAPTPTAAPNNANEVAEAESDPASAAISSPLPSSTDAPVLSTNPPPPATDTPAPPTLPPLPPEPQRIELTSDDGAPLVGMYYPAATNPAPIVVLMHWAGGVFIFDFRGYGESGPSDESSDVLVQDARAAYATALTLPGVDPAQMAGIGASIGSDAVVDGCIEPCLGALSLSPGSYLGVPYADAVTALDDLEKPVWCVAAEDDETAVQTCQSASGDLYQNRNSNTDRTDWTDFHG